jgi:hypothetical protein
MSLIRLSFSIIKEKLIIFDEISVEPMPGQLQQLT